MSSKILAAVAMTALSITIGVASLIPRLAHAASPPSVTTASPQARLSAQRGRTLKAVVTQRRSYPAMFEVAYQRYPELPRGVLESIARQQSNWYHLQPSAERITHGHMPPAWGVMGLYHGYGFEDQVTMGAELAGLSVDAVLHQPQANILAAAALLDQALRRARADARPSASMESILATALRDYAGFGPHSAPDAYARQSFAWDTLHSMAHGVHRNGIVIQARDIDIEKAFTAQQLRLLRAPFLRIKADTGGALPGRLDPDDSEAGIAPLGPVSKQTMSADYGPAIWNPAYWGNYSTAWNSTTEVIMHTMEGSYAGAIAWFKDPNANVSAHYCLRRSDGQITQMVRETETAWHAAYHNGHSIGLEHEGYASAADNWTSAIINASAALVMDICADRGIDCSKAWQGPGYGYWHVVPESVTVKGHGMLTYNSNRYDPGQYFPWATFYSLINGGAPPPGGNGQLWVDTYADASGFNSPTDTSPQGTLNAGTNYVYCKAWGRQVNDGNAYNSWWMKTDLDTGEAGRWVSAFYLSNWGNDEARDNAGTILPLCPNRVGTPKYFVDTWASASGYNAPTHTSSVGTLNAGSNYVYCKAWGRKIGDNSAYNHWWMRTDLDSGGDNKWVSAYYSNGGNDEAKTNDGYDLPECMYLPYGAIGIKYYDLGGIRSALGAPTSGEMDAPLGGRKHAFDHGIILWTPGTDAWAVHGMILDAFQATGGVTEWGYPTMDEADAATSPVSGQTGRYQYFQHALLLWTPSTGAHVVGGAILTHFENNGREAEFGYPTMNETDAHASPLTGQVGRFQYFEDGLYLWTPTTDAWIVRDHILDHFKANGRENVFGFPLEDAVPWGSSGVKQAFEMGTIYWSPATGTHWAPSGTIFWDGFESA